MSAVWTIYRRELAGLFLGPLAWVLLCLALALNGLYFPVYLGYTGGEVGQALQLAMGGSTLFWGLVLLLPPLITMRMISEEARTGLLEFLLTAPVSDLAVVLGKLLAATTLMALLFASPLVYGLVLAALGTAPDWGPLLTGFLGATLVGAFFCGLGLAASAATSTPLVAGFLALVASIVLLSLSLLVTRLLGLAPGHWAVRAAGAFDPVSNFQGSFQTGALDTRHVVYFLAWTGFFVFLATRLLEVRRWR